MFDLFKAKKISADLDRIEDITREDIAKIKDGENKDILTLGKEFSMLDYSYGSRGKEKLKERLLKQLRKHRENSFLETGALTDEDLDYAAAGINIHYHKNEDTED